MNEKTKQLKTLACRSLLVCAFISLVSVTTTIAQDGAVHDGARDGVQNVGDSANPARSVAETPAVKRPRSAKAPKLFRPAGQTSPDATLSTVVCFGDSITNRGYPKELAELLGANVYGAGVGGHTTRHALKRLKKEVLNVQPDVVIISFGTNDSRLAEQAVHVPLEEYVANLKTIVKACKEAGIQPILSTVPPIDAASYFTRHAPENFEAAGGLEKVLASYRECVVQVAKEHQVPVVDLNRLLATKTEWLGRDGVHPSRAGNRIIAEFVAEVVRKMLP